MYSNFILDQNVYMSYQELSVEVGKLNKIATIAGSELVGMKCENKVSLLDSIIVLPMDSSIITEEKVHICHYDSFYYYYYLK